ncbi:hypothetical protein [Actinocatenispora comari]|jgi:hypothetical protein|uniref:Uncharacterized protein n=1 Tax=Actinocatenispora comari TaxID=2807577 RepID=A0A8J4AFL9_9ACTN|nr:hypothetical protein [Actinocatenispora comari]GIL28277.1 hypothetical protein NUM_35310 [Actinocatenispora comari]
MTSGPAIDAGRHAPAAAVDPSSQVDMEPVVVQEIRPRCRECGRDSAGSYGLGWSRSCTPSGEWWLCATCTRATVGAVETCQDGRFA